MKTHPLNVSYLVIGLVFLGLAGSWALRESGVIDLGTAQWLLPATLVAAGAVGLIAFAVSVARGRSRADQYDHQYDQYDQYDHDDQDAAEFGTGTDATREDPR
ncbi:MAG TPA: hypothetical protein VFM50_03555 [Nocardioidaceae bacterium]|nr:hypothetical protein [Nocardioidaceae bacterium]